jgi:hypothetical protein
MITIEKLLDEYEPFISQQEWLYTEEQVISMLKRYGIEIVNQCEVVGIMDPHYICHTKQLIR